MALTKENVYVDIGSERVKILNVWYCYNGVMKLKYLTPPELILVVLGYLSLTKMFCFDDRVSERHKFLRNRNCKIHQYLYVTEGNIQAIKIQKAI